jgi:hypothetical protein
MTACAFGKQLRHSRACNSEPLCNLLVRESDSCQFGGAFTALLTKSLLLFSRFSDSHGSPVPPLCSHPPQPPYCLGLAVQNWGLLRLLWLRCAGDRVLGFCQQWLGEEALQFLFQVHKAQ